MPWWGPCSAAGCSTSTLNMSACWGRPVRLRCPVQPAHPAPCQALPVRPTPIRDGLGQVLADKAFCRLVLIPEPYAPSGFR